MKPDPNIDWDNLRIVVLPISGVTDEFRDELLRLNRIEGKDDTLDMFVFVLPLEGRGDSRTVRVYIGSTMAAKFRDEADTYNMTYDEVVQMRLMVSMMESYVIHDDKDIVKPCINYARTISKHQLNSAFALLDYFSAHDDELKMDKGRLHNLIRHIQRNR